ncbi:hypothetical protein Q7C36_018386 [Tachysurus vachellii]|uniref:Uncharacterized protein n=1 Tax=Tachysurus vachellii TaxID=175792 RepID=A0AA88LZJ8_TACVA|nr:hypothetical protein Q7C36_018386 [Tachysurus vachellii]
MSRPSSPEAHWDQLETWLNAMTGTLLPETAVDLQHLSREQLDHNLSAVMSHNPAQDYSHKELAKIRELLTYNLIAQTKTEEKKNSRLQQESLSFQIQAEEARRNLAQAHDQLDRIQAETQSQREQTHLKEELDTTRRELKHAYRLQRDPEKEMPNVEFPLTSGLIPPKQESTFQELFNFSRNPAFQNIPTFMPDPAGGNDIHAYLQDIDFHLQTVANVTTRDQLYLLRITSSREVRSFLDRQPDKIKEDYQQLQEALIKEFSDPESDKDSRNEPGMEEDFNFKTLFLRNLHPAVSHHLGVLACAREMSIQQLRDLAQRAYTKQRNVPEKNVKGAAIYSVSEQCSELALEGTQQRYHDKPVQQVSRHFPINREPQGHGGTRPKYQAGYPGRSWDRPRPPRNLKDGATWEGPNWPKGNWHSPTQTSGFDWKQQKPSQHAPNKLKHGPPITQDPENGRSETAEILRMPQKGRGGQIR